MGKLVTQITVTRTAGENLTDKYFVIADPATEFEVLHPTAANMEALGCIVRGGPLDGEVASVCVGGIVTAIAYGAINEGDYVVLHSTGAVKTDPKTGSSVSNIVGRAMEDASTGQQFEVLIGFFKSYNA